MTRTSPRPRHQVGPLALTALKPVLRYSASRDAYVLRAIGNRTGPVFTRRRDHSQQQH